MNRYYLILTILLFLFSNIFAQIPSEYYASAAGKSGSELRKSLNEIIDSHVTFPYTSSNKDTWDILKEADADPEDNKNVILVYARYKINGDQEYNDGTGWSREHVWAKSRGDFGNAIGTGTDVHNLKPSDISINSSRGNKDFDDGGSLVIDNSPAQGYNGSTACKTDGSTWEPPDEVKGDIARIMFYMAVRYEGNNGEPDLELVEDVFNVTSKLPKHGVLSSLIKWHKNDPVDDFEKRRNEVIYSYQKNRNPFIDHPEFVDSIWRSDLDIIDPDDKLYPKSFILESLYPNPFNPNLNIAIDLLESSSIEIIVYNISGLISEKITLGILQKGKFNYKWSPKNLSSGIYFIAISNSQSLTTKKITYLK